MTTEQAELLAQTRARLALYISAEAKILQGQEYTIGDRSLTRANLEEVRKEIEILTKNSLVLARGSGIRIQNVVMRND